MKRKATSSSSDKPGKQPKIKDEVNEEVVEPQEQARNLPRISTNSLRFFERLDRHNDRDWFKEHEKDYHATRTEFIPFVQHVYDHVLSFDDDLPADIPAKDLIFRIYRDVRFGGLPYKPLESFAISRHGRKSAQAQTGRLAATYYVHIQPGQSFVGGGVWCPDSTNLNRIRQKVGDTENPQFVENFLQVLESPQFISTFGKDSIFDTEYVLKKSPKGYNEDHEHIKLLKLKSFTVSKKFTDEQVTSPDFANQVVETLRQLHPFVTTLNVLLE